MRYSTAPCFLRAPFPTLFESACLRLYAKESIMERRPFFRVVQRGVRPSLSVCHAGNGRPPNESHNSGLEPLDSVNVSLEPAALKAGLLKIISNLVNDSSQVVKVGTLVVQLESLQAIPVTEVFTEMALAGSWRLLFSSSRTRTKGNVRIRRTSQDFIPEKKQLINTVLWSFLDTQGKDEIYATLHVVCSYAFAGPGRLSIEVQEHKVRVLQRKDGKPNNVPDDLAPLIIELQMSLPPELFDPSGLVDVSYIEPDFRLARFLGKRVAGVRNIFSRIK